MSVYRTDRSPFYQYDFEVQRVRFFGSTKCKSERDAKKFEALKRAEARETLKGVLSVRERTHDHQRSL